MKRLLFSVLFISFLNCGGLNQSTTNNASQSEIHFSSLNVHVLTSQNGPQDFLADLADTQEKRSLGLMYRSELASDAGMLFVFETVDRHGFFMRNTLIPLDMIFIDENKTVSFIEAETIPLSETPTFPTQPILYVLEINGGECAKRGIAVGDRVDFDLSL